MSFSAFSSSISVLFWFSNTATRFSRHLTYSFFFRRHSRAASLHRYKGNKRRWATREENVIGIGSLNRPIHPSLGPSECFSEMTPVNILAELRLLKTQTVQRLPPVLHQPDLPLAGDLLSVLWRWALHDAWGRRRHHDALSQARVGRAQLVGRDVSGGGCGVQRGRAEFDYQALTWAAFHSFCDFLFKIMKNKRMFNRGCLMVNSSALLPVWEDRFPATWEFGFKVYFEWIQLTEYVTYLNKEPRLMITCVCIEKRY